MDSMFYSQYTLVDVCNLNLDECSFFEERKINNIEEMIIYSNNDAQDWILNLSLIDQDISNFIK
jgi:hypothetical protein